MKTNNRLSKDNNTHEQKVRPMVKEIEYRHFSKGLDGMGEWFPEIVKDKFWEYSGNTREVERPMTDTEYIEYLEKKAHKLEINKKVLEQSRYKVKQLEKENQELQEANNLLATDYNKLKALADKVDLENHSLINEVKYLKDKFDKLNNKYQQEHVNELFDLKKQYETKLNQFLKVVESVIKEHHIYGTYRDDYGNSIIMCNCENEFSRKDYKEHLLQEIKSAIEKGK